MGRPDLRVRILNIAELQRAVGVDYAFLHGVLKGVKQPGPALARQIEAATGGLIAKWELRPDIWDGPDL